MVGEQSDAGVPVVYSNPDDPAAQALRQAARRVTQIYERHLGEVGLTAAQFTILAKLARTPGLPMVDLADAMVMERTGVSRMSAHRWAGAGKLGPVTMRPGTRIKGRRLVVAELVARGLLVDTI